MLFVGALKIIAWASAPFDAGVGIAIPLTLHSHAARNNHAHNIFPALVLATLTAAVGSAASPGCRSRRRSTR